jgi:hypothetical protein
MRRVAPQELYVPLDIISTLVTTAQGASPSAIVVPPKLYALDASLVTLSRTRFAQTIAVTV